MKARESKLSTKKVWRRIFGFKKGDKVCWREKDRRYKKGYKVEEGEVAQEYPTELTTHSWNRGTQCYIVQLKDGSMYLKKVEDLSPLEENLK